MTAGREKKKEAPGKNHKRLLYSFNVNRTSQDHLLLGGNADVDKSVEWTDYSAGAGRRFNWDGRTGEA